MNPRTFPNRPYVIENRGGYQKDYVYYLGEPVGQNRNVTLLTCEDEELLEILGYPDLRDIYNKPDWPKYNAAVRDCIDLSKKYGYMDAGLQRVEDIIVEKTATGILKRHIWKNKVEMLNDPMFPKYFMWFWRWAHQSWWVDPYNVAIKEELLSEEKVKKGTAGRTFCYCGPYQYIYDSILFGEQDQSIKNSIITRCGWIPVYGGSRRLVREIRTRFKRWYLVKCDARKFDYTSKVHDMEADCEWVTECHQCQDQYIRDRIRYSYWMMDYKFFVDFNRCIRCGRGRMPSGCKETSNGNSRRHLRALFYHARRIGASPGEFLAHVVPYIMSDDHLYLVDADWRYANAFISFENRQRHFAEVGILLKKEENYVTQQTVEGHVFLGVHLHDDGICHYDIDKMLESAGYRLSLTYGEYIMKLESLLLLIANDEVGYSKLQNFAHSQFPEYPFMSRSEAMSFFNGTEGSGSTPVTALSLAG